MSKAKIIESLAREQRVEKIVSKVFKTVIPLHGDAADLAQMLYLSLLKKPAKKIVSIDRQGAGAMDKYLAGMVLRSIQGQQSEFNRKIRRPAELCRPLTESDTNTDIDVWERLK